MAALSPSVDESLDEKFDNIINTRKLLINYLRGAEDIDGQEARDAVGYNYILGCGRARLARGEKSITVSVQDGQLYRRKMTRSDN